MKTIIEIIFQFSENNQTTVALNNQTNRHPL